MPKKSTTSSTRAVARRASQSGNGSGGSLTDLLWRIDRLERQVMRLSELVRAHAEDEDRLVRIVAEDHEVLRRELIAKDGGKPVGSLRAKGARPKVGASH